MIVKYLKISAYSFLGANCLFSHPSIAMLQSYSYHSESFNGFESKSWPLTNAVRSMSSPSLPHEIFEKNSHNLWTLTTRKSFLEATQKLSEENIEFKSSLPTFIQYKGDLHFPEDFKRIEKWLELPHIQGFSIIVDNTNREFRAIYRWYTQPSEERAIKNKLVFMSLKRTIHQKKYMPTPNFDEECLNNHIKYYALLK